MSQNHSFLIAAVIFLVTYVSLILPVALWPHESYLFALVWVSLYGLLACSLSVDVTELLLSFFWTHTDIPFSTLQNERPRTAVLMTICDDSDELALLGLAPLAQAGYAVFVLDDSSLPTRLPNELRKSITHCCRQNRTGAKAGNLNEWLKRFGSKFENIVILDADSTISVEAVDKLACAAAHPSNTDIAIFQSKIAPRIGKRRTLLSHLLGIAARPRTRVLECVHARLGLLVSFGHNQLIRISALMATKGFSEQFTSEDTALTLSLSELGFRVGLVDVWSYDTEPENINAFVRRTVRWARQTVEIFRGDWRGCPLRLKLLLCRHLLSYILPAIGFILLLISIIRGPCSAEDVLFFLANALLLEKGYFFYGVAIWLPIIVLLFRVLFHLSLALLEGVALRPLLLSMVVAPSLQAILLFPVVVGMVQSCVGFRAEFIPTNSRIQNLGVWKRLCRNFGLPFAVGCVGFGLIAITAVRPGSALVGFNFIWLLGFAMSPLVVAALSARCWGKNVTDVLSKGAE